MAASRISERFCSPEADIVFRSSEGVLIKFFRLQLTAHSNILAAEGLSSAEIVQLTEREHVLDILFQFMNKQLHPNLEHLSFKVLAGVAEAAEKYEVFAALGVVRKEMFKSCRRYPLEVLNYAVKHGHSAMADQAAIWSTSREITRVSHSFSVLQPAAFSAWIKYYDHVHRIIDQCANWGIEILTYQYDMVESDENEVSGSACPDWYRICAIVAYRIKQQATLLSEDPFHDITWDCDNCCRQLLEWGGDNGVYKRTLRELKSFSSFLS